MSTDGRTDDQVERLPVVDTLAVGMLFLVLSLLTGRIFRNNFDDEIVSLQLISGAGGMADLFLDLLHAIDVHPPISYLVFYACSLLGAGPHGLRTCSILFSTAAVMLAHRIVGLMAPQMARSPADRVIPIVLLASTPLLVSQGDAIRWYPLFVLIFMLCIYAYLREPKGIFSSLLCGVLISTNFLGLFVFPLLELDRASRHSWRIRFTALTGRTILVLVPAVPGLLTLWNGMTGDAHKYVGGQIGGNRATAAMTTSIGFFGGNSLGLVQSLAIVPFAVLSIFVLYRSVRDASTRSLALNFAVVVGLAAAGFAKPRSFSYLALSLSVLYSCRWIVERSARVRYLVALIGLGTPLLVAANIKWNDTPYKRNAALPVEEIVRFARYNASDGDVIVVSDPVLYWDLKADVRACVTHYLGNAACDFANAPKVIVIDGYGIGSDERDKWLSSRNTLLGDRREIAAVFFGIDHEAWIKRRLIPGMDDFIMKASVYSRER